jgi:hypothetical protein
MPSAGPLASRFGLDQLLPGIDANYPPVFDIAACAV